MACAAANMVMVKQLCRRYPPWSLTALQVAAGAMFLLPGLALLLTGPRIAWGWELTTALTFLGACVSLGAFGPYNWGMSRLPASRASAFVNLVPVVAVAIGWLLMGEPLSPPQSAAALAVVIGVWLSQVRGRPQARTSPGQATPARGREG
jgi:drug/metabolite transporter (DMT)-like permease